MHFMLTKQDYYAIILKQFKDKLKERDIVYKQKICFLNIQELLVLDINPDQVQ